MSALAAAFPESGHHAAHARAVRRAAYRVDTVERCAEQTIGGEVGKTCVVAETMRLVKDNTSTPATVSGPGSSELSSTAIMRWLTVFTRATRRVEPYDLEPVLPGHLSGRRCPAARENGTPLFRSGQHDSLLTRTAARSSNA